jgi:hypothetical protein
LFVTAGYVISVKFITPLGDGDSVLISFQMGGCAILTLRALSSASATLEDLSPPALECHLDRLHYFCCSDTHLVRMIAPIAELPTKYDVVERRTKRVVFTDDVLDQMRPYHLYKNRLLLTNYVTFSGLKMVSLPLENFPSPPPSSCLPSSACQLYRDDISVGHPLSLPNGPHVLLDDIQARDRGEPHCYLNMETLRTVQAKHIPGISFLSLFLVLLLSLSLCLCHCLAQSESISLPVSLSLAQSESLSLYPLPCLSLVSLSLSLSVSLSASHALFRPWRLASDG